MSTLRAALVAAALTDPEGPQVLADWLEAAGETQEAATTRAWGALGTACVALHHGTHMVGPFTEWVSAGERGSALFRARLVLCGRPHVLTHCSGLDTGPFGLGGTLYFLGTKHPYVGPTRDVIYPSPRCFFLDTAPQVVRDALRDAEVADATRPLTLPFPGSVAHLRRELPRTCLWVAMVEVSPSGLGGTRVVVHLRPAAHQQPLSTRARIFYTIAHHLHRMRPAGCVWRGDVSHAVEGRIVRWSWHGRPLDVEAP